MVGALLVIAILGVIPTPYYLLAPGNAVDLTTRIAVEGRVAPRRRFYLTDVSVIRASALLLAAALLPGTRLVKADVLLPPGETLRSYDHVLTAAMDESQRVAAYVAERAAGFRLPPPQVREIVEGFTAASRARPFLRVGDRIVRVGRERVRAARDVAAALASLPPGTAASVVIERGGRLVGAEVPTIATPAGRRLGVALVEQTVTPELPVPVHYSLEGVEGSSGGLMFALAIYAQLHADPHATSPVAGTGTIAPDGAVGRIEGTRQKLIAAERAGAELFLVPRENYPDVEHERGIRIVPVDSFAGALSALRAEPA